MNDVYIGETTEVIETDNIPFATKNVPSTDILEEVGTETPAEVTIAPSDGIFEDDTEILESVNNPNYTQSTYTETVVVQAAESNKAFGNSGFEVAVVLCLSIIIGIIAFYILTRRWFA